MRTHNKRIGYDIGGAGGSYSMEGYRQHFGWDNAAGNQTVSDAQISLDKGLINGLFALGAVFGALANPWVADRFGRRVCIFTSSVTFIIGAAIQSSAVSMAMMWAGRFIGGVGIGMISMCVPVYIAEAAPEHARGSLSTLWQLATTFGILVASLVNIGVKDTTEGGRLAASMHAREAYLSAVSDPRMRALKFFPGLLTMLTGIWHTSLLQAGAPPMAETLS